VSILVKKKDGTKEPLDIRKIQKHTARACKDLDNVSASELEVDVKLQFTDCIETTDIQNLLIKTAVEKTEIDAPEWKYVAGRLLLDDIYKDVEVYSETGFSAFIERMVKENRFTHILLDYDLCEMSNYIDESRDYLFTYHGLKMFRDRYLTKDADKHTIEKPQWLFMAVAMHLASNELDKVTWAKKFYDILSKHEVMSSTPTISNGRTVHPQLSSCYVGRAHDSIEGLTWSTTSMSILSKYGGGIGWDYSCIRPAASDVRGIKGTAAGVVPQLKILNDSMLAFDQLGTRKGSAAPTLQDWHPDFLNYLDIKKNSGEERHRAHDIFPAVWLSDLFMQRVENNETWSFIDVKYAPALNDLTGKEFEDKYLELESRDEHVVNRMNAKEIWKCILRSYFETGSPFLGFKDTINTRNQNSHAGRIYSSNLCQEITENTYEGKNVSDIVFIDGTVLTRNTKENIVTDRGTIPVKVLNNSHSIDGKQVAYVTRRIEDAEVAVCNLASINLSKVRSDEDLARVVPIVIRMLDNVIDLNFYPIPETYKWNMAYRGIGLGAMGEHHAIALDGITYGTDEHREWVSRIYETISYEAINASADLAIEKGTYARFKGSNWHKGILPIDTANKDALALATDLKLDWDTLRRKVKENGVRNGYMLAIAPTSSISILTGTTSSVEPIYKRKFFEENMSGTIPVVVPDLSPATWSQYTPAYDLDMIGVVKTAAVRQIFLDQSQSLNMFVPTSKASGKYLNEIYTTGYKLGVKTFYYLRSESPEAKDETPVDNGIVCHACE
jgi:ribonucleoside-diphosphate reductase alpha chain